MTVPRSLAWTLLLGSFFVSGLLRQWNHRGSAGLLLTILLLLLAWMFVRSLRTGTPAGGAGDRVSMIALLPFLLLVIVDKWFALVVFEPSLVWIPNVFEDEALAGIVYTLMTALGLFAVCLLGLFFFRPLWPRIRLLLSLRALAMAAAVIGASVLLLYGGLYGFLWLMRDTMPSQAGYYRDPVMGVMIATQAMRAVSEELYFRGLLQENLAPLLATMGFTSSRRSKMVAIALVSLLFMLEHAAMEGETQVVLRELAFVGYMSVLFGVALVISRSLYLAMGLHFVVNLFMVRGGIVFIDPTNGAEIFDPRFLVVAYSLILFIVLFFVSGGRRRKRLESRRGPRDAATQTG